MGDWFGAPSEVIARVGATTAVFYVTAFVLLRVAGRRTLAEFSAFDVVITISIGSIIASTAVAPQPAFAQGLTALTTLMLLQLGIAFVRLHWKAARRALDFPPEEVVRNGEFSLKRSPLGAQLTEDELRSTLREKGFFDLNRINLVILEPTGDVSVATHEQEGDLRIVGGAS